jgi:hypothetical protein
LFFSLKEGEFSFCRDALGLDGPADLRISAAMCALAVRHFLAVLMVAAFCISALAPAFVPQDAMAASTMTEMSGMEKPDCAPCKASGDMMPLCVQMHCLVIPAEPNLQGAKITANSAFTTSPQPVPKAYSTSPPVPPI